VQTFSGQQGWHSEGNARLPTILDVALRGTEFVVGPFVLALSVFLLISLVFFPP